MTAAVGFFDQLSSEVGYQAVDVGQAIEALSHSAFLGLMLMVLTAWVSKNSESFGSEIKTRPSERIFSAANVLYLCFGMSGMMLLVNNNIARAFAIAAAIALVRFRIKVNSKILSMSLFYGVLSGMACGVGYTFIGYILVTFFGILQLFILAAASFSERNYNNPKPQVKTHFTPQLEKESFHEDSLPR